MDNVTFGNQIHPRCECHECTQARYRMSAQNALSGPIGATVWSFQPQGSPLGAGLAVPNDLQQPDPSKRGL